MPDSYISKILLPGGTTPYKIKDDQKIVSLKVATAANSTVEVKPTGTVNSIEITGGNGVTLAATNTSASKKIQINGTTYANATTTSDGLMSAQDKQNLENIVAASGEPNQNAFSNIKVGNTTISAGQETDTFELAAGTNITLTPITSSKKIEIQATNTTYAAASSAPGRIASAGSAGSSTSYARADHTHAAPYATNIPMSDASGAKTVSQEITDLKSSVTGAMHYIGITTTAITDNSTTATINISGTSKTMTSADAGSVVIYGNKQYVWNGSKWQEFGSTGSLKSLAFVDTAYTSATTVTTSATLNATPNFSSSEVTLSPIGIPGGSVNTSSTTVNGVSTQPSWGATVNQETLTISWSQGTLSTATVLTNASFAGSQTTFTCKYTPAGSVSLGNNAGVTLNNTTVSLAVTTTQP